MAITIGNHTKNSTVTAASITLTKPSAVEVGSLLLIILTNDAPTSVSQWDDTTNKPSGFTFIGTDGTSISDAHYGVFYRIADGTETSTINCPADGSYDTCGFYINILGTHNITPYRSKGDSYTSTIDLTSHDITGVIGGDATDIVIVVGSADGGDCHPFTLSGTGWNLGDEEAVDAGTGTNSGLWGWNIGSGSSRTASIAFSSTADGFSGIQMRFIESPLSIPTEIRETLYDNSGVVYPNGTTVYCYNKSDGSLALTGSVGAVTGHNPTYGSGAGAGEAVFRFPLGDLSERFLSVEPLVDVYGLITNHITPTQLT